MLNLALHDVRIIGERTRDIKNKEDQVTGKQRIVKLEWMGGNSEVPVNNSNTQELVKGKMGTAIIEADYKHCKQQFGKVMYDGDAFFPEGLIEFRPNK